LINLFSKWILFIYRKIPVCEVLLIKLYFKATSEGILKQETTNKKPFLKDKARLNPGIQSLEKAY